MISVPLHRGLFGRSSTGEGPGRRCLERIKKSDWNTSKGVVSHLRWCRWWSWSIWAALAPRLRLAEAGPSSRRLTTGPAAVPPPPPPPTPPPPAGAELKSCDCEPKSQRSSSSVRCADGSRSNATALELALPTDKKTNKQTKEDRYDSTESNVVSYLVTKRLHR